MAKPSLELTTLLRLSAPYSSRSNHSTSALLIINNINGYLNILYGLELLIPSSGTGTRNCDIRRKLATRKKKKEKRKKNSDLLKMCLKFFWQNKYNHDVPEKRIYWASQYDDLLAVSIHIYKIRKHRSNIPQDKSAVFPVLLNFFEIKASSSHSWHGQVKILRLEKNPQNTCFIIIFPKNYDLIWWGVYNFYIRQKIADRHNSRGGNNCESQLWVILRLQWWHRTKYDGFSFSFGLYLSLESGANLRIWKWCYFMIAELRVFTLHLYNKMVSLSHQRTNTWETLNKKAQFFCIRTFMTYKDALSCMSELEFLTHIFFYSTSERSARSSR